MQFDIKVRRTRGKAYPILVTAFTTSSAIKSINVLTDRRYQNDRFGTLVVNNALAHKESHINIGEMGYEVDCVAHS